MSCYDKLTQKASPLIFWQPDTLATYQKGVVILSQILIFKSCNFACLPNTKRWSKFQFDRFYRCRAIQSRHSDRLIFSWIFKQKEIWKSQHLYTNHQSDERCSWWEWRNGPSKGSQVVSWQPGRRVFYKNKKIKDNVKG